MTIEPGKEYEFKTADGQRFKGRFQEAAPNKGCRGRLYPFDVLERSIKMEEQKQAEQPKGRIVEGSAICFMKGRSAGKTTESIAAGVVLAYLQTLPPGTTIEEAIKLLKEKNPMC